MAETVKQEEQGTEPEKTFTQSELNAIISDRLNREREKYAGFEDFKAKAEKYDAQVEAEKTDLEKAQEQANSYKAQLEALRTTLGKSPEGTDAQLRKWVSRKFITYSCQTGLYSKTDEYLKGNS